MRNIFKPAIDDSQLKKIAELESRLSAAEMEARQAQELRAKVAAIDRSQGVIEFKLDGTVIAVNDNFLKVIGYRRDEIVGHHHSMFVDATYASSLEYESFWKRLNAGEFVSEKFHRLGKGKKDVWIQASYNPLFDENGTVYKVIKFATDVTDVELERQRAEAERQDRARALSTVVSSLATGLKEMANGNFAYALTEQFAPEYEQLRRDYNVTVDRLQSKMATTMRGIADSADHVRSSAADLATASDDLAQRTERQAAALEEITATLKSITETVKEAARNTATASETASDARLEAEEGEQVVTKAVEAMGQIKSSADQVAQIISVIDEIAFQTNLLALNAGVEAARAGEAGRGFAVVASEVRSLAQRAADSAKQIKGLIGSSNANVASGVALVAETGQALRRIRTRIGEISKLTSEVADSSRSQAVAIQQISAAVTDMDRTTQQTAAMVEESTAAVRALADEADTMAGKMSAFTVESGGRSVSAAAKVAPLAHSRSM